jgi:hypothetical protein
MVVMNNSAYVKKIKIGIISARAHLLQARQNHREVFSKGLANASVVDCRRVNNEIGKARYKLYNKFGVIGKCNDDAYRNASVIIKSLFISRNNTR